MKRGLTVSKVLLIICGLALVGLNILQVHLPKVLENYSLLSISVLKIIFIGVIICVLRFAHNKMIKNIKIADKKMIEVVNNKARLLDEVFRYFDRSFLMTKAALSIGMQKEYKDKALETATKIFEESDENDFLQKRNAFDEKTFSVVNPQIYAHIDELIGHSNNLMSMLRLAEQAIPKDVMTHLDQTQRLVGYSRFFSESLLSYEFYASFIHEFVESLTAKIETTSEPLSKEILAIKDNANKFVGSIESWKNDVNSNDAGKNFSSLLDSYNDQNKNFGNLIHIIESTQNKFQTKLDSITKVLEELNSQNIVIQEIAENIGILSINASIEAARAGNSGRGFHVISEEVKKLSTQTNVILEKMNDAMADAKKQIAKTVEDYKDDNTRLSREITSQKGSFEFFYGVLSSYEKDFSKIFGSAAEMMEKIDGHIKQFNPMFQLHEISIQELANLNSIINEFFARQGKEISDSSSGYTDINKEELFAKQILEMEKRSISEFELAVIKKMISLYGLDGKVILGKTGSDIEFF